MTLIKAKKQMIIRSLSLGRYKKLLNMPLWWATSGTDTISAK